MTFKVLLVTAASVLAVSPAFALTNSQIIHHSGGPIPYSELVGSGPSSSAGYNTRASRRHHKSSASSANAAQPDTSATGAQATPAPNATAPAAPPPGPSTAPSP